MDTNQKHKPKLLWFETEETAQKRIDQARSLKEQAEEGGLKVEVWLDGRSAAWILEKIENSVFMDPAEAVSVYVDQAREIDPYPEAKRQILNCIIQTGVKDIEEGRIVSVDTVQELLENLNSEEASEPAVWVKIPQDGQDDTQDGGFKE